MGLFDKKSHIKNTKEFRRALDKVGGVSDKEKRKIVEMFKDPIMKPSGLSKKEFEKGIKSAKGNKEFKMDSRHLGNFKKAV